jgi:MFS family permease
MVFKNIVDGVVEVSILPALTAMTLGVVGKTRFHKKVAATTNITKFLGVSLGTGIFGFVAYAIWPDLAKAFSLLIVGGILMLICIFFMLTEGQDENNQTIDHRLARGRSTILTRVSQMNSVRNLADKFVDVDSDNEEDDDEQELVSKRNLMKQEQDVSKEEAGEPTQPTAELSYTQVLTYRQMYSDPKRRRSLIFLSLVFFTYHLANSTTLPLLGQYMTIHADAPRKCLPITSCVLLVDTLSRVLATWALSSDRAANIGYNKVLFAGGGALFVRLVLVSILVNYYPNPWVLGATQVLDGIGGACIQLMLMLYSHLLSRRTGHYNLKVAIINTWKKVGAIVGVIVGGAIATKSSYETVFPVLAGVVVFPALFTLGVSMPDLKRLDSE